MADLRKCRGDTRLAKVDAAPERECAAAFNWERGTTFTDAHPMLEAVASGQGVALARRALAVGRSRLWSSGPALLRCLCRRLAGEADSSISDSMPWRLCSCRLHRRSNGMLSCRRARNRDPILRTRRRTRDVRDHQRCSGGVQRRHSRGLLARAVHAARGAYTTRSARESPSGVTDRRGRLVGVMGIQDRSDVTLIRHAYVQTARRGEGIGRKLLGSPRRVDRKADPDWDLACRDVGDQLLREERVRDAFPAGDRTPPAKVLEHLAAAVGSVGGARERALALVAFFAWMLWVLRVWVWKLSGYFRAEGFPFFFAAFRDRSDTPFPLRAACALAWLSQCCRYSAARRRIRSSTSFPDCGASALPRSGPDLQLAQPREHRLHCLLRIEEELAAADAHEAPAEPLEDRLPCHVLTKLVDGDGLVAVAFDGQAPPPPSTTRSIV